MKANIKVLEIVGYTITVVNGGYWIVNPIGEGMSVTKPELAEVFDKLFKENF